MSEQFCGQIKMNIIEDTIDNDSRYLNDSPPIYPDVELFEEETNDQSVDRSRNVKTAACRDVAFLLCDYFDISQGVNCELRVIRYGIDTRACANESIYFKTLAWAVHGNEECTEFIYYYPDPYALTRSQVQNILELAYLRVMDYVRTQMNLNPQRIFSICSSSACSNVLISIGKRDSGDRMDAHQWDTYSDSSSSATAYQIEVYQQPQLHIMLSSNICNSTDRYIFELAVKTPL